MPYRPTERTRAKAEQRRETVLRAASQVVAEFGWRGTTVAAVARAAQVSHGNVYTHFPDKAALLGETFRRLAERERNAVAEATTAAASTSNMTGFTERGVSTLVDVFARRALRGQRLAWALLAEPADPAVEAARLDFRRHYADILTQIITTGIDRGEIPDQNAALSSAAIVGAIGDALVGPLSPATEISDTDEVVERLRVFCLQAIGVQPTTRSTNDQ